MRFLEAVTLHGRAVTGQDAYGNDVLADVDTTIGGAFAPSGSTELVQGRDTVIDQPTLYLGPDADVTAVDAVTVRGVRYDVDGTAAIWVNPYNGWRPGIVVRLRAVTG